jgi:hypothetical protein
MLAKKQTIHIEILTTYIHQKFTMHFVVLFFTVEITVQRIYAKV